MRVRLSGFYVWFKNPLSKRSREDACQTELIRKAWKDSVKAYSYRKLHDDLLDEGETICLNRNEPGCRHQSLEDRPRLATMAGGFNRESARQCDRVGAYSL